LRVAYDAGSTPRQPTGVGRYASELAQALEDQGIELRCYVISLRAGNARSVSHWWLPARVVQASWRMFGIPTIEGLVGDVDVVHGPNFVLPPIRRAAGVVTVHDLSFERDEYGAPSPRLREMVPWSIERAQAVLVPSHAVAYEVHASYGVDRDRLFVTPEGVSRRFFEAAPMDDATLTGLGVRRPFVLTVGTLQPRKNLHRLVEAWKAIRGELAGWSLVLAGARGWGPDLPEAPAVVLPGYVDDSFLPGLVAAAEVFCFPSLYEGFGLPPLEAMAAGTAVLAGDYSAAPEVLGDAALVVDRHDVDSLARGLHRLAGDDDLRSSLATLGRRRASMFTWERTAGATLAAYRAALIREGHERGGNLPSS
jgi:glycosyltransferase involved in cell wall biosynthesis